MIWLLGIMGIIAGICLLQNIRIKKQMREMSDYLEQYLTFPEKEYEETLQEGEWANLHNNIYSLCRQWKFEQDRHKKDLKEMNHFVENLAHQMKNALTSLQLRMDELDFVVKKEKEKELCEKCQNSILRIEAEVEQLLNSSLLAEGKVKMKFQVASISELLAEVLAHVNALCEKKGVAVAYDIRADAVLADPFWFSQALENIIKNAVEYTKEHTEVTVQAVKAGASVCIRIKDQGEGITEEQKERLFERYYRGDENKKGYGIGLSMAKDIIEAHHGRLECRSESGNGVEFRIIGIESGD